MRWERSADTLVLKSYCITLCDGCGPSVGQKAPKKHTFFYTWVQQSVMGFHCAVSCVRVAKLWLQPVGKACALTAFVLGFPSTPGCASIAGFYCWLQ